MSKITVKTKGHAVTLTTAVALPLLTDLQEMIRSARERVASAVDAELTMLYWRTGDRLHKEILQEKRAEYGKQIIDTIAVILTAEFGNGFGRRNLFRMIQFAEQFPEELIVSTLSAQLSWSHILEILVAIHRKLRFSLVKSLPGKREYAIIYCKVYNTTKQDHNCEEMFNVPNRKSSNT